MASVATLALVCAALATVARAEGPVPAVIATGEVRAVDAQSIHVPPAQSSPVVLRFYRAEGSRVEPGDPVLRIDPGDAANQVRQLQAQMERARATADKEIAERELALIDARIAVNDAEAALSTARIDAGIPEQLLSALDHERYQGEARRAEEVLALARSRLEQAAADVERRREDARLEMRRLQLQSDFQQAQLDAAEVRAERAGTIVQGFDPWQGHRYEEGATAQQGAEVGQVVGAGPMAVRAWVIEVDRHHFPAGAPVRLGFDAFPGHGVCASVASVSAAPEPRSVWGESRYYTVDVALPSTGLPDALRPGMSARLRPGCDAGTLTASTPPPAGPPAPFEGELFAASTVAIMPPAIPRMWRLTIAELVPEGQQVSAGQQVMRFEAGELTERLSEVGNRLNEKRSQRQQLVLSLAEREREARLAAVEAASERDKAQRKASQPEGLVRRLDYSKLAIDRDRHERRAGLFAEREVAARRAREAERALAEAEVDDLQAQHAELESSIAALGVAAPRDGLLIHRSDWQGTKFDVGSQVWMGMAVAEIPDAATLAVRGTLPERDLRRVRVGDRARVRVEGAAGRVIDARVVGIGAVVRSLSRVQPIPVIEVELAIEGGLEGLRPGMPVRIEMVDGEVDA